MLTLSSIASSTTRTGSISPAIACAARAPTSHPRIDRRATECEKLSASEAPDPGRHHVGTPGDIISECPGDFVGIRKHRPQADLATQSGPMLVLNWPSPSYASIISKWAM